MSNPDAEIATIGWTVGRTLGEGAFGLVKLVTRKSDGVSAACKIMAKPKSKEQQAEIDNEYKIMKSADHQYIVKCYEAVQTTKSVFLFLELMSGGELFDQIVEMGSFTERTAADVAYKLLGALNYLHGINIIHRDLKPENLLLAKKGDLTAVKLTDFGLSAILDDASQKLNTACGTPGYVAPEVLTMGGYNHQVDVWSMGVIIYITLCGFPPFYAESDDQLYRDIKAGKFEFTRPFWDPISEQAKDVLKKMMVVDPKKRATINELLQHPWLKPAPAKPTQNFDLRRGRRYSIKETQVALAKQTITVKYALVLHAKILIAKTVKRRRARIEKEKAQQLAQARQQQSFMRRTSTKGPGALMPSPKSVSGGFCPRKSSANLVDGSTPTKAPSLAELQKRFSKRQSSVLTSPRPEGAALGRTPSSGGFRPRTELLSEAKVMAKEGERIKQESQRQLILEAKATFEPTQSPMKRAPSGLTGAGMLQKAPSVGTGGTGGFKPRKVTEQVQLAKTAEAISHPQPAPPTATAEEKAAAFDIDDLLRFERDANWFHHAYEKTDDNVKKLLRGPSTSIMKEILDDEGDKGKSSPSGKGGSPPKKRASAAASAGSGADPKLLQRLVSALDALVQKDAKETKMLSDLAKQYEEDNEKRHIEMLKVTDGMNRVSGQIAEVAEMLLGK